MFSVLNVGLTRVIINFIFVFRVPTYIMPISLEKSAKSQSKRASGKSDTLLWVLVVSMVGSAVVANYHFSNLAWAFRLSGWVILSPVVLLMIFKTAHGQRLWVFAKEARIELRKVVWPTREETVRTTMLIGAMVIAVSLILWGIDTILLWIVSWLTGGRG